MLIKNAKVYTPEKAFEKLDVSFQQSIDAVGVVHGPPDIDAEGCYLIPGLIDIHTHGAVGHDFSDGSAEGNQAIAEFFASHGVTSYCATLMTLPEQALMNAASAIRDMRRCPHCAHCAGLYLEGPFLSNAKRGAQAAENLHVPDIGMFRRLNRASGGNVKLVGIAPELPGAPEFIREASHACTVSIAHTGADYTEAKAGYEAGATSTTHLFNGMNELHHRNPGVLGAAFDSGAYAEIICDGIHIHPSVIRMAFRLFREKLILVSDSLRCASMPDGSYTLGGQTFTMAGGKATLPDGTLAGSSINLLQAVQNVISWGISPEDAIAAATMTPAKAIGMEGEIGSISAGMRADMLLLDSQFRLLSTIINGETVSK